MRRSGFSLLEVIFAVAITVTALLALQAAVSGGILSAADSVTRRAARVLARGKMEQILAGVSPPDDSGTFEQDESISYSASVEEHPVGLAAVAQTESVRIVRLEVSFSVQAGEDGRETVVLTAALPAEGQGQGPQ